MLMELSERYIKKFEEEGFDLVYEWQDPAGKVYDEHTHKHRSSLFVTDGSITLDFGGEKKEVVAGERYDVPIGQKHTSTVGPNGWIVIIAEDKS